MTLRWSVSVEPATEILIGGQDSPLPQLDATEHTPVQLTFLCREARNHRWLEEKQLGACSMEPTKQLIDDIFRERVLRARRTPPEEKLLDGPRLFDRSCRIMKDGIRDQFPNADEQRVHQILLQRLAILRRLENYR
jgi:hypothetical protein